MNYKNIILNIAVVGAFIYVRGGSELSNHIEVPSFKEGTILIERVQTEEVNQGVPPLVLKGGTAIGITAFFLSPQT